MILAIDPGETVGWFGFNEDGSDTAEFGQLHGEAALVEFLSTLETPTLIIVESFTLYGHKAIQQSGSKMITPQVIGMLKMYARQKNVPLVEQPASILPIAEKWSGIKVEGKGGHGNSHWKSAFNHGVYYLVKNNLRKTKLQETAGNV